MFENYKKNSLLTILRHADNDLASKTFIEHAENVSSPMIIAMRTQLKKNPRLSIVLKNGLLNRISNDPDQTNMMLSAAACLDAKSFSSLNRQAIRILLSPILQKKDTEKDFKTWEDYGFTSENSVTQMRLVLDCIDFRNSSGNENTRKQLDQKINDIFENRFYFENNIQGKIFKNIANSDPAVLKNITSRLVKFFNSEPPNSRSLNIFFNCIPFSKVDQTLIPQLLQTDHIKKSLKRMQKEVTEKRYVEYLMKDILANQGFSTQEKIDLLTQLKPIDAICKTTGPIQADIAQEFLTSLTPTELKQNIEKISNLNIFKTQSIQDSIQTTINLTNKGIRRKHIHKLVRPSITEPRIGEDRSL
jgi:hypothetical protein